MEALRRLREALGTPWAAKRKGSRVAPISSAQTKHIAAVRKPFTLLAFREAGTKLEFVFPAQGHGHHSLRIGKALLRKRRGYGRRLGAVFRLRSPCDGVALTASKSKENVYLLVRG